MTDFATPILGSLEARRELFQPDEIGRIVLELSHLPTQMMRYGFLRRLEGRSDLIKPDDLGALRRRLEAFHKPLADKGLLRFSGHVGMDADGGLVDPKRFKFRGMDVDGGVPVYVSERFFNWALQALNNEDFAVYFRGTDTTATKTLALAQIVVDHNYEDLQLASEDDRVLLAWELLARVDHALNGATGGYISKLIGHKRSEDYERLKGFIESQGLRPMSMRALAIRDRRDSAFLFPSGQGAKYLGELKLLIETEPGARELFNKLKPLYARYNIDLDELLRLGDGDQNAIENYLKIYGVAVSMPVGSLVQLLRLRAMESYGYNPYDFTGVTGQSGGQPFAYFAAGAFEKEGYRPPLVPRGPGGYHSMESIRHFAEWMLIEGELQQRGTEPHYAADVTEMEPLIKRGEDGLKIPSPEEIDRYFSRYRIVNMAVSGIPYDVNDSDLVWSAIRSGLKGNKYRGKRPQSHLGRVLYEINKEFAPRGSYVYMSNLNTGATPTGKNSWYILVGGRGPALAELAKLIIHRNAEGYSDEVKEIAAAWGGSENVRPPITNTLITLAPHDAIGLQPSFDEQVARMGQLGIRLRPPQIPVIHNWTGEDVSKKGEGHDHARGLLAQQFVVGVDVPRMVDGALALKVTSVIAVGPGGYLASTALPAIVGDKPIDITGVVGRGIGGIDSWERVTTSDPTLAYVQRARPDEKEHETALTALSRVSGVTVKIVEADDASGNRTVSIRLDNKLQESSFEALKSAIRGLDAESDIIKFLDVTPLVRNAPNMTYQIRFENGALHDFAVYERDYLSVLINFNGDGNIVVSEGRTLDNTMESFAGGNANIDRVYRVSDGMFVQTDLKTFRARGRAAYALDWKLGHGVGSRKPGDTFTDEQKVTSSRMAAFARAVETRDARYWDPFNSDFQAHPHLLIDLMWRGMISPAFIDDLDLDFTRVIDEGKEIQLGVPIQSGDTITTTARILRVEDFKNSAGSYEGRRVVVAAVATNQRGEVVGRVVSTLVSRISTRLGNGETRVTYTDDVFTDLPNFVEEKRVYSLEEPRLVAKGSLGIPSTLADSYAVVDNNRIHLSDSSALLAGIPKGRVMQGLGTLAYVNEQVMAQMRRDGIIRDVRGVSGLRFSGFVYPGDELTYEVARVAHLEGDHKFEVAVKKGPSTVIIYNLFAQGPKTAIVFPGQGSQHVGMGDDIVANGEHRAMLDVLQSWIPRRGGRPMVDLFAEMNSGTQDTSKAQPMIVSYELILFVDMLWDGLIPDDAVYTGHSLGMWSAYFGSRVQSEFKRLRREGQLPDSKVGFLKALKPILKPVMEGVCMRGAVMQKYADEENPQGLILVLPDSQSGPFTPAKIALLQDFINEEGDSASGRKPRYIGTANYNMRNLTVLGGHVAALDMATPILQAWGFRVRNVSVKNAFHTRLMQIASDDFGRWMARKGSPFQLRPDMHLYMDTMAVPLSEIGGGDVGALATTLQAQISTSVRWHETVNRMLKDGVARVVEIGPSSSFDREKGHTVGSSAGQLATMVANEVGEMMREGALLVPPEVVFANPILAQNGWSRVIFEAEGPVSEYTSPRFGRAQAGGESGEVTDKVVAVVEPAAQAPAPVSASSAPAQPTVVPVSLEQVQAVIAGFMSTLPQPPPLPSPSLRTGEGGGEGEGAFDAMAQRLSEQLVRLGAGAVGPLQARLASLGSAERAVKPSGPSIQERIVGVVIDKGFVSADKKGSISGSTCIKSDLGIGSSDQAGFYEEVIKALGVNPGQNKIEALGDNPTIEAVVEVFKAAGAREGGDGSAVGPSPAEQVERRAIELALPVLRAQLPQAGGASVVAAADPAVVSELRQLVAELQARVTALESGGAVVAGGTPVAEDKPVQLAADGSVVDEREAEIAALRDAIANIIEGTRSTIPSVDSLFVTSLMQPHFKGLRRKGESVEAYAERIKDKPDVGDRVYGFYNVKRNGGRTNLMQFIIDLRTGRLPEDQYDFDARINRTANQMDEISLNWLAVLIESEKAKGRTENVKTLQALYRKAERGIKQGKIITANVITVRGVNFVPEYGSPHRVNAVVREEGTQQLVEEMKPLADPKTPEDLDWLLQTGADLRGMEVLVQQAGTLSGPLIAKLLQLGADVYVTDFVGRSDRQPNRQLSNDYYWHLYNDHAARGARLTVIPHVQPGNPHDEADLIKYLDENGILPQMYINGAGLGDYGAIEKRGDPLTVLSVLALSSRFIALNLAKLHQKHRTGEQVLFMNYFSPNNAGNLAETEGELVPTVLPGSSTYPTAKAALGAAMTAAEAKANGLVWEDGRPILVQVDHKTGWGKSNGDTTSLMSGNDFFTMELERLAKELGFDLLTLTGDQLATVHLAGILAAKVGKRKGAEHLFYNDTFGFDEAAKRGVLGDIMARAARNEVERHQKARAGWEARQVAKPRQDPAYLPNDGSIIDPNNLNIAIRVASDDHRAGVPADHRYAMRPGDLVFGDDTPVVTGYGMVGPLGPDAVTNYRAMLAKGHFQGHEGFEWLGEYDFYRLAQAMGVDVSGWNEQRMAESVGLTADDAKRQGGDWGKTFRGWLVKNSGIQQVGEFLEFEVYRDVSWAEETKIDVSDPEMMKKMVLAGFKLLRRPNGSVYALAKPGQTYKLPVKYRLPVTIAAVLPGHNVGGFDWAGFGIGARRDTVTEAHASQMAKMFTAQILMSMGGYSPNDLARVFGEENLFVSVATGLGDLKPFNRMTTEPLVAGDRVANYLMAGLLPDASAGQIATEQIGARGMAACLVAACSTGNANIIMAVKEMFGRYYLATRESGEVNWPEVFRRMWIAGGVDYAATFNAIFGFVPLGALIADDWREGRDLVMGASSRPDDEERHGFVVGVGGGAVSLEPQGMAKRRGGPVYSHIFGGAFRTDGDKITIAGAREGYGQGQRDALFDAWDQARHHLTEHAKTHEEVWNDVRLIYSRVLGERLRNDERLSAPHRKFRKASQRTAFTREVNRQYGTELRWRDIARFRSAENLADFLREETRVLKKNVKFVILAHKTSTGAGDPYEEESLRVFLSKILPPGEFAHIMKTKAHIGHLLGGSSGADAALTPLLLRFGALTGTPGLDNLMAEAAANPHLLHNREAINLNELYDPDTTFVVIREAAGFNSKNSAVFEVRGKVPFDTEEEAHAYVQGMLFGYAMERSQKRAERTGLRKMAFSINTYRDIPIAQFADLYALALRTNAVAGALLSGRKFDFENIQSWIYEFPVNEWARIAVDSSAGEEVQLNQHNAIKYAEANGMVADILESFDRRQLDEVGRVARERGWDRQPVVFYGASDGMGLRTLLALIESGAVKEVVGVHFDTSTDNPKNRAVKTSAFTPAVLKAYAASKGVNLQIFNENGILYAMRNDPQNNIRAGDELPLQPHIADAIEAARARTNNGDLLFWDFVAFGAPYRSAGSPEFHVPTIDEYGQLSYAKVGTAKDDAQGQIMTLNPMGHNHDRLLKIFLERRWLGRRSVSFSADWWGSESEDMLHGVYGGALLGDAKLAQKRLLREFAGAHPRAGKHGYVGYPAFMSFALHQIPGGTLTGLIAERIYEDIEDFVSIDGIEFPPYPVVGYNMEELAVEALLKAVKGEYTGPDGNKIDVDEMERIIAREIDRRFKLIAEQVRSAVAGDPDAKLTPEKSYEILKDHVPEDYLKYVYQHIKDPAEKQAHMRLLRQEKEGIERLPLPETLQTEYPFFARAYGKALNTPELAIAVIEAGGVGVLAADDLSSEELDGRITAVKRVVGDDAPLIVNVMMSNSEEIRNLQIEVLLENKPAAVSFGNGYVTTDIVQRLHEAGILAIQLTGTSQGAKTIAEKGVDLVIAERNYGPGHFAADRGSDPEKLVKTLRQELYDAGIPVIAGGGFVDAGDVQNAFHWGASAVQLDDVVAYSAESGYAGKSLAGSIDKGAPVLEIKDEDGKPLRALNTSGARKVHTRFEELRGRPDAGERILRPLIAMVIGRALEAAANGDLENGLFLAGSRIASIKVDEPLAEVFQRLSTRPADVSRTPIPPVPAFSKPGPATFLPRGVVVPGIHAPLGAGVGRSSLVARRLLVDDETADPTARSLTARGENVLARVAGRATGVAGKPSTVVSRQSIVQNPPSLRGRNDRSNPGASTGSPSATTASADRRPSISLGARDDRQAVARAIEIARRSKGLSGVAAYLEALDDRRRLSLYSRATEAGRPLNQVYLKLIRAGKGDLVRVLQQMGSELTPEQRIILIVAADMNDHGVLLAVADAVVSKSPSHPVTQSPSHVFGVPGATMPTGSPVLVGR